MKFQVGYIRTASLLGIVGALAATAACGSFGSDGLQSKSGTTAGGTAASTSTDPNSSSTSCAPGTLNHAYYNTYQTSDNRQGQVVILSSNPNLCDSGNLQIAQGANDVSANVVISAGGNAEGSAELDTHASDGNGECYFYGDANGQSSNPGTAELKIFQSSSGETVQGSIVIPGLSYSLPATTAKQCNFPTSNSPAAIVACSADANSTTSSVNAASLQYGYYQTYTATDGRAAQVVFLSANPNECDSGTLVLKANQGDVSFNVELAEGGTASGPVTLDSHAKTSTSGTSSECALFGGSSQQAVSGSVIRIFTAGGNTETVSFDLTVGQSSVTNGSVTATACTFSVDPNASASCN
jgi:hypothetical protein